LEVGAEPVPSPSQARRRGVARPSAAAAAADNDDVEDDLAYLSRLEAEISSEDSD